MTTSSIAKNLVINLNKNNFDKSFDMNFNIPCKNKNNIYEAKLITSLVLKLPQLEIKARGKNEDGNYEVWYDLDIENKKNENLILCLQSLDKKAIDLAIDNSVTWFKKKINHNLLRDSYQPFYGEENDKIVLKLEIHDEKLLEKFRENHMSLCTIEGLKFYANKYMYSIVITDVSENNDDLESIDFIKYLDKKDPLNKVLNEEQSERIDNNIIDELGDIESTEMNLKKNIEISTINTNRENSKDKVNIETKTRNLDEEIRQKELKNLETKILKRRKEARDYFVSAEKAGLTASKLRKEAIKKAGELKKIENKFDELSQTKSKN
mgnify:CR=1 FL=1